MGDHGQSSRSPPPGITLLRRMRGGKDFSYSTYRISVLGITFIAYAFFHMSRKPPSIVKSVLDPEGSVISTLGSQHYLLPDGFMPSLGKLFLNGSAVGSGAEKKIKEAGWAPFDGKTGKKRLGEVDVAFLASYALGMYFAGHLGDRLDLRKFLSMGMVGSGFFVCLFGMGRYWNIHRLEYFLLVQMVAGLFQATGWPSVVTIVGHWFGKKKRGLIMGIWNAHTSVGNILGSLIAAAVLKFGWGWSFILPGSILAGGGLLVWGFLAVDPHDVGLPSPSEIEAAEADESAASQGAANGEPHSEQTGLLAEADKSLSAKDVDLESQQLVVATKQEVPELGRNDPAVGFLEAWRIPGVATFALCLFFSKLVAYTFLYWLPFYIRQTPIAGDILDEETAGQLSTLFDVGGVVGGIVAGHLSDKMNARAITAAGFMYAAIPALFLYRIYGSVSLPINIALMMIVGVLVNGPYALITTAVSADLGTHSSLKGNGRALATVTAIIDGTGSLGAAVGPLLTGYLSGQGWSAVFIMLMVAALFAGLLLTKLVVAEVVEKLVNYQRLRSLSDSARAELTDLLLGGGRK